MDKKLTGLMLVFFLSFVVFISVVLFNKPLSQLIRASQEVNPSATNSLVLAWPLTVSADGESQSTITIFLRNDKNYPVPNKSVSITTSLGQVKETSMVTTKDGKAEFHLLSNSPGVADITALSGGLELSQKISIKFE